MPVLIKLMALGAAALTLALGGGTAVALNQRWRGKMTAYVRIYTTPNIIFLLSASGIVGALLLEYAGSLPPCSLCWWQRVFMFPIAIIAGIAVLKKQKMSDIADYVLALALPGAAVALYQHILQMAPTSDLPAPCDAANDCATRSVFEFGFVTLPWMAFVLFAILVFIAFFARKNSGSEK